MWAEETWQWTTLALASTTRNLSARYRPWFRTDADYLEWLRWPDGYACQRCSHTGGWRMGDDRSCATSECGGRTSAWMPMHSWVQWWSRAIKTVAWPSSVRQPVASVPARVGARSPVSRMSRSTRFLLVRTLNCRSRAHTLR